MTKTTLSLTAALLFTTAAGLQAQHVRIEKIAEFRTEPQLLEKMKESTEQLPGRRSPGSVYVDGKLYVVGGHFADDAHDFYGPLFLNTFSVLDVATQTWTQLASRNHPGRFSQLAAHNNYIYSFGGFYAPEAKDELYESYDFIERYDIQQNKWEVLDSRLASGRSQHAVVQMGTKVYLIGGWDSAKLHPRSFNSHKDSYILPIEIFDLETEEVSVTAFSLPEGRRGFSAIRFGEEIIISAGFSQDAGRFLDSIIVFNPKASSQEKAWRSLPSFPEAMIFPQLIADQENLYLIAGTVPTGRTSSRNILGGQFVLKSGAESWELIPDSQPRPVLESVITRMNDHQWIFLGGRLYDESLVKEITLVSAEK